MTYDSSTSGEAPTSWLSRPYEGDASPLPLGDRSRYLNRELSWLRFNERVLEEARDATNPLAERLNFLSIVSSNLDEFFMIRVASLHDQVHAGYKKKDPSGLTPADQLEAIAKATQKMVKRQYSTYARSLVPLLLRHGVAIVSPDDLTAAQREYVARRFEEAIFPVLTPMAIDASRPFPLIANQTINMIVAIDEQAARAKRVAIVQIPKGLPRLEPIPLTSDDRPDAPGAAFIFLEDIVRLHLDRLFPGIALGASACFRITRNADLDIDEEDAADLLSEIEHQLKRRPWGEAIRLEIERGVDETLLDDLIKALHIGEDGVYRIRGPIDLTCMRALASELADPSCHYPHFTPRTPPSFRDASQDVFRCLAEHDVLLHHPYESFDPVIKMIQAAAKDPNVLAIKQTLYRVSGKSPIVAALAEAAERGKQVFVLVELKARFDEENNIVWARRLEQAGCHVIYGLMGLKTHSKITLIVRQEDGEIKRYVHLGTGNYNDITAKIYTDLALLTSHEAYGRDATDFFNMISGYSKPIHFRRLITAPTTLKSDTLAKIRREQAHAEAGRRGALVAKINALVDTDIIDALYEASRAGVSIDLIVRGICCLRPGIQDLSETIRVRSLVGRFLEHSRIFYYHNDGQEEIYLSSADWMPRNLERRVEILFPIEDDVAIARIKRILDVELRDTDRARLLNPDGTYRRIDRRRLSSLDSQVCLMEDARQAERAYDARDAASDRYVPRSMNDAIGGSRTTDHLLGGLP